MSDGYILLIEDNFDDEKLSKRALRKNRIANDLVVAHDGAEAVALLFHERHRGKLPALTLLDLKLPKIDGLEVLQKIRTNEETRLIPVRKTQSDQPDRAP